ncbi:hypothetical protein Fot_02985 [Forsythia ovata]|uniref:Uncharacterized protein n=1 Tax=Forsythia ovata TaxID=205694 RepID=A0ABD1X900_9LAMI
MENQHPRRLQQAIIPRSQRLLRCQSVSTAGSSLQEMRTNSSNSAPKSATKSRSGFKREENDQNPLSNKKTQKKTEEITDAAAGFVRFFHPVKVKRRCQEEHDRPLLLLLHGRYLPGDLFHCRCRKRPVWKH